MNGRLASRLTLRGKGQRPRGEESTLDLEAGSNAPARLATVRVWTGGAKVCGPWVKERQRGGPLSSNGAPAGVPSAPGELASGSRGPPELQPRGGSCGEAGRRTCGRHSGPHGAPRPAASAAAQPTWPRSRISDGPYSRRLNQGQSSSPRQAVRH